MHLFMSLSTTLCTNACFCKRCNFCSSCTFVLASVQSKCFPKHLRNPLYVSVFLFNSIKEESDAYHLCYNTVSLNQHLKTSRQTGAEGVSYLSLDSQPIGIHCPHTASPGEFPGCWEIWLWFSVEGSYC